MAMIEPRSAYYANKSKWPLANHAYANDSFYTMQSPYNESDAYDEMCIDTGYGS